MTEETPEQLCLAIDIGGSKMAVGLVDRNGTLHWSDKIGTPRASDADALFAVLADLVVIAGEESESLGELSAVGIGCGGPIRDGRVSPVNIHAWRDFPLAEKVRALPPVSSRRLPLALDNDAKALALAEGWRGAGKGRRNFLAMVVSTGIGGGIVLDGRLLEGEEGNAGHIGHVIVEPDGRKCGCGAFGCLEAEASGTAIAAITGGAPADAPRELRERAGSLVGRAIASVANLLDLRLALVGGSVALGYGPSFFLAAQREVDRLARLAFSVGTRVKPVALGAEAPLVGAAAVGWRATGVQVLHMPDQRAPALRS